MNLKMCHLKLIMSPWFIQQLVYFTKSLLLKTYYLFGEREQNILLRRVKFYLRINDSSFVSLSELKHEINLSSLHSKRIYCHLIIFYKINYSITDCSHLLSLIIFHVLSHSVRLKKKNLFTWKVLVVPITRMHH